MPDEAPPLTRMMAEQYRQAGIAVKVVEHGDRAAYSETARDKKIDHACCFDSSPRSTFQQYAVGNAQQPGEERVGLLQRRQVGKRPEERLLRHVLRHVEPRLAASDTGQQRLLVAQHEVAAGAGSRPNATPRSPSPRPRRRSGRCDGA